MRSTNPCPFTSWLHSPAGARLLVAEREKLRAVVRRFHGDGLLWVGSTPQLLDTTAQCMVRTRLFATSGPIMTDAAAGRCDVPVVRATAAMLPFPSGTIDGILLHHTLESATDARAALREAARVLRVGGLLVVVGFHPLRSWLLAARLPAFRSLKPVSVRRLRDWLALLGLEAEDGPTAYQPKARAMMRPRAPTGGVYLVRATKVAHGFIATPLRRPAEEFANAAPSPVACVRPAA